ncbi:MAG: YHS domain-containing protein [Candidatus Omnitrophota bacterium]
MKVIILTALMIVIFIPAYVRAEEADDVTYQMQEMQGVPGNALPAVEVGNTICLVSGEEVDEMGEPVKHNYNGKIYSFCCSGCVEEFKKDPKKYIKIFEDSMILENTAE